ncbi:PEP-CTERM sorting domain-containing protein [Cerasicoccus maritimus]|uniref:PEP-CTERM sorting domain-containing protein n=1 Tax=Cerasicoccus maritimus TaxID=490089 RepID=UPI002852C6FE|nr:PEP-CTERM sorting domain-containing protein [Cerasicoccus maritimus]
MINSLKISLSVLVLAPALLNAQTILIDFNGDDTPKTTGQPETWNNPVNPGLDSISFPYELVADLADTTGAGTGITLSITDGFHGRNSAGDDSGAVFPGTATEDSFYTANDTWDPSGGTLDNGFGILEFTGLDPSKTYDFTVYASRIGGSDNRETEYAFDGLNSSTVYLDVANNISSTVIASGLSPTAGGIITLTVTAGPNNTTSQQFAYLGAIEMTVIPESSSIALFVGAMATGFVMWRRRR